MRFEIHQGSALSVLREMPEASVNCCITSPPYFGLRDYKTPPVEWPEGWVGSLGLEPTPEMFISHLVCIFAEVRRVLRPDGTLWVNIGDTYAGSRNGPQSDGFTGRHIVETDLFIKSKRQGKRWGGGNVSCPGYRVKNLIGIPWMLTFGLRADGWNLRQDIIWSKSNPMPESVKDRCTKSHEYIFLFTKSKRYAWNFDAIQEPVSGTAHARGNGVNPKAKAFGPNSKVRVDHSPSPRPRQNESFSAAVCGLVAQRNIRSVWTLATMATPEAHFATFPLELPELCMQAGCPEGGTVLDPFAGAGTTGLACLKNNREFVGIELNAEYIEIAMSRARKYYPLLLGATA